MLTDNILMVDGEISEFILNVVTDLPTSPTVGQVVIHDGKLKSYHNGDWQATALSTSAGFIPYTTFVAVNESAADFNANLGYDLSISGDGLTMVAGMPNATAGGVTSSGKVALFTRTDPNTNVWTADGVINGTVANEDFGYSVNLNHDGTVLVVAAHRYNSQSGRLYVYTNTIGSWILQDHLIAPGASTDDVFGVDTQVNAAGTLIAGLALWHDGFANNSGGVFTFNNIGGWAGAVGSTYPPAGHKFREAIEMSTDGTYLYIGTVNNALTNSYVWEYTLVGNQYENPTLVHASTDVDDAGSWGLDTNADNTVLAIGAEDSDVQGVDRAGRVYVYRRNVTTQAWELDGELISDEPENVAYFGKSVDVSNDGTVIAVGAFNDEDAGVLYKGAIHIFEYDNGSWIWRNKYMNPASEASTNFGTQVEIVGDTHFTVASAFAEDANGFNSGRLYALS